MAGTDSALQQAAQEEDQRTDLTAMIAASRELGPDMDHALVDSYLTRHREAIAKQQAPAPAPAPARNRSGTELTSGLMIAAALAVYCVALVASHGFLFWLIFPMMGWLCGWGFWGSGNRSDRHAARREYHQQRWELRQEYRARRRVPGVRPWEWQDQERDDDSADSFGTAPRDSSSQPPTIHV